MAGGYAARMDAAACLQAPRERRLRQALKSDHPSLTPESLAQLAANRVQHALVLLGPHAEPTAAATLILEPKLLRGGTTVAHVCEMAPIPPNSSSSSYAPIELLLQLIEEARRTSCYKIIADVRGDAKESFLSLGFREAQMVMEIDLERTGSAPSRLVKATLAAGLGALAIAVTSLWIGSRSRMHSAALATTWLAFFAGAESMAQRRASLLLRSTALRHHIRIPTCSSGEGKVGNGRSLVLRRLTTADDHGAYLSLLAQLSVAPPMTAEDFAAQLERSHGSGAHAILVAEPTDGGPIVACGTLVIEQRILHEPCAAIAHIEDVVVDQRMRGCGLGRVLIEHLLAVARDCGCSRATLNCTPENASFYERCGMRISDAAGLALYF